MGDRWTGRRGMFTAAGRAGLVAIVALCIPASGQAMQGNWVTSFLRTDDTIKEDTWRSNLDLRTANDLPWGASGTLRGSFTYYNRNNRYGLDAGEGSILRHRWYADVQKSSLRLRTQFVPWQDVDAGNSGMRERVAQFDLNASARRAPSLSAHYHRLDRMSPTWTPTGVRSERSSADDWRAQLSYALRGVGSSLTYRRLETRPSAVSIGAGSQTDDWRAGLHGARTWSRVSLQGAYDASYSTYATRDRDRKLYSQRASASSSWNPNRRLTLGGSGAVQWGRTEDNALPSSTSRTERFLTGSADYRPMAGLSLRLLREYREQSQSGGDLVSDFLRGQAHFGRDLFRGFLFQAGAQRSVDLASRGGSIPLNTVYGLLDGRIRQGIAARAELRASRAVLGASETGTQWSRSFGIRTAPVRTATVDVSWRRDTLPRYEERAQTDEEWQYTFGYQPVPRSSLVASYRRLKGTGRLVRQERFGSVNASVQIHNATSVAVDWSRRESLVLSSRTGEIIFGADVGFWLPDAIRAKIQWRRVTRRELLDPEEYGHPTNNYGFTLDKSF